MDIEHLLEKDVPAEVFRNAPSSSNVDVSSRTKSAFESPVSSREEEGRTVRATKRKRWGGGSTSLRGRRKTPTTNAREGFSRRFAPRLRTEKEDPAAQGEMRYTSVSGKRTRLPLGGRRGGGTSGRPRGVCRHSRTAQRLSTMARKRRGGPLDARAQGKRRTTQGKKRFFCFPSAAAAMAPVSGGGEIFVRYETFCAARGELVSLGGGRAKRESSGTSPVRHARSGGWHSCPPVIDGGREGVSTPMVGANEGPPLRLTGIAGPFLDPKKMRDTHVIVKGRSTFGVCRTRSARVAASRDE